MIQLQDVSRTFFRGSTEIHALRGASLHVRAREVIAIQGPSGSGKTTLLCMVGTLDRPTSGTIIIDGINVWNVSDQKRSYLRARTIGFVFQSYNLIPELPAWKNVALPLRYGGIALGARKRRAIDALAAVGLEDRVHHLPSQLSGGEEQRVAIARSMVIHPHLLLADEPTGNLDSQTGSQIIEQILTLSESGRTTILVVTHDPKVANRCARRLQMLDGQLHEYPTALGSSER
ncbi:ABC transporter ATP-binding protein [Candidatus Bipolaricaulota bacterium]|nr:ABC transporter ATP-binding protein [Candidatus Bipolaricaulota bacterium]